MMKRHYLLVLAGIVLFLSTAFAQKKQKTEKAKGAIAYKKPVMDVVLGNSEYNGGTIDKQVFDSIARQGVKIMNAAGAFVEGFSFTYAERNLYEDSVGNEKRVTEYLTEYCMGDTLSPIIASTIVDRTKAGDTAYFDDIHIRLPDGKPALGRPMKFVITW